MAAAAIGGAAILLLWPTVSTPPEVRRRLHCRNNLKQIGLALHNYHDVYGRFPPAIIYGPGGEPWHSWRVLIMPMLESSPFYGRYRFDEPWNGPNNRKLAAEMGDVPLYRCPSDSDAPPGTTNYLAVIGDGTMWPPDGAVSYDDVADGASNTIQIVEVAGSGVHWMEPRDLEFDRLDFSGAAPAVRGPHGRATHWFGPDDPPLTNALFADVHVETLDPAENPAAFRSMLLRADGEPSGDSRPD